MSGIIGVLSNKEDVSVQLLYGLYGLQHRGQLNAGVGILNGGAHVFHGEGSIKDAFNEKEVIACSGKRGLGHVRYGIYEGYAEHDIDMPCYSEKDKAFVSLDGNILNPDFRLSDFIDAVKAGNKTLKKYLQTLKGAFALMYMDESRFVCIRDRWGLKPLTASIESDRIIVASESCAIDTLQGSAIREIMPGEVLSCEDGITSTYYYAEPHQHMCAFEFVYLARPDSYMSDKSVYRLRSDLGRTLYQECPTEGDIVVGAPDSGLTAARGYAEASGIPCQDGIIKNRYIARTFINPKDSARKVDVSIKLNPVREIIEGKRIILVDDSIVKGITIMQTVAILRKAGAKEVHVRISAPPVYNYCSLSLDMPDNGSLVAPDRSIEEIREMIGADSLYYISLDGFVGNMQNVGMCTHCFKSDYPIKEEA